MMNRFLPIMLGCYGNADKCIVAGKDKKFGKYSLFICRLKEPLEYGATVEPENIQSVIAHLHFCNLTTAQIFRDGVIEMVKRWGAESNG